MKNMTIRLVLPAILLAVCNLLAEPAAAYVGPGAGIGGFIALAAIAIAVFLALVGFIWYPLKRLLRARKSRLTEEIDGGSSKADTSKGEHDKVDEGTS